MAYPNDIDSFRTVATDDDLLADDKNNLNSAVVAIETELGTLPKGGKADVKTRLNDVDTSLTEKVAKSGDTMTGDLKVNTRIDIDTAGDTGNLLLARKDQNNPTYIQVQNEGSGATCEAEAWMIADGGNIYLGIVAPGDGNTEFGTEIRNGGIVWSGPSTCINADTGPILFAVGGLQNSHIKTEIQADGDLINRSGDIEVLSNSKGLILNSATKRWRVTIDDTGTLQTTEI